MSTCWANLRAGPRNPSTNLRPKGPSLAVSSLLISASFAIFVLTRHSYSCKVFGFPSNFGTPNLPSVFWSSMLLWTWVPSGLHLKFSSIAAMAKLAKKKTVIAAAAAPLPVSKLGSSRGIEARLLCIAWAIIRWRSQSWQCYATVRTTACNTGQSCAWMDFTNVIWAVGQYHRSAEEKNPPQNPEHSTTFAAAVQPAHIW